MGQVEPTQVVRVTVRFKNTVSGDVVNVYHYKLASGTAVSDANVMADMQEIMSDVYSGLHGQIAAANVPYDLRVDHVEQQGQTEAVVRNIGTQTWVIATPPDGSGDSLPQQSAGIINFRTLVPRVFGRKFIGVLTEASHANGSLISAALTNFAAAAVKLVNFYEATNGTWAPGVLSVKGDAELGYFLGFVGFVVNAVLGTQRRRRINRGS